MLAKITHQTSLKKLNQIVLASLLLVAAGLSFGCVMALADDNNALLVGANDSGDTPLLLTNQPADQAIRLDMSTGSASVELGPVVVNVDGTLSRITSWDTMTDDEKKRTARVLAKRNRARLEVLKNTEDGLGFTPESRQALVQDDRIRGKQDNDAAQLQSPSHQEL